MIYRRFVKLYYGYFHGDLCRYGNERNIQGPVLLFSFKHGGDGENVICYSYYSYFLKYDYRINAIFLFFSFIVYRFVWLTFTDTF